MDEHIKPNPEQGEANNKTDGISHSIVATLQTPKAIRVDAETQERKTLGGKIFRFVEFVGITAVVVYTAFTYELWQQGKQAFEETKRQTYIQERAFHISNGAFLQTNWGHVDFEKATPPFQVWFNIENVGKKKASIYSAIADVGFLSSPPIAPSGVSKAVRLDKQTLDSQEVINAGFAFKDWPAKDYLGFRSGYTPLFVWGEIHYSDGLGWDEVIPFCRYTVTMNSRVANSLPCDCWDTQKNEQTEKKDPTIKCPK